MEKGHLLRTVVNNYSAAFMSLGAKGEVIYTTLCTLGHLFLDPLRKLKVGHAVFGLVYINNEAFLLDSGCRSIILYYTCTTRGSCLYLTSSSCSVEKVCVNFM